MTSNASPASTTAGGRASGRGAKRASAAAALVKAREQTIDTNTNTSDDSDDDDDDDGHDHDNSAGPSAQATPNSIGNGGTGAGAKKPDRKKRKRNRQALSCSECQRRKIKCDRHIPCEACIKRGEADTCQWEEKKIVVPPQPFALASEHDALKGRVAELEAYIDKRRSSPKPNIPLPTPAPLVAMQMSAVEPPRSPHHPVVAGSLTSKRDAATEDAALVLTSTSKHSLFIVAFVLIFETDVTCTAGFRAPEAIIRPGHAVPLLLSRATESLLVPLAEGARRTMLDSIWRTVPSSKQFVDWLVHNYFANYDWSWHLHHIPLFQAEYESFQSLCQQGRRDEIDPLWLAVFFQTLCLSVHFLEEPVMSPTVTISKQDLMTLPQKYFEAAEAMLQVAEWKVIPRYRTLQTISLFSPYLLWMGNPSSVLDSTCYLPSVSLTCVWSDRTGERLRTYVQAGVRMARSLGLHKLGEDPTTMPVEGPGLPSGAHTLRREMALRLLRNLLFVEWVSTNKLPPEMTPNLIDSALPGNFEDVDLLREGIVQPRPYYDATDVSYDLIKWRIALVQRAFNDIVHGEGPLSYSSVLDLDRSYREIIDSFPTRYLPSYVAPFGEPLTTLWSRSMALQTINSRLVRLHRPFMYRGYTDSKYRISTDNAIVGARTVLMCQQSLDRAPPVKGAFQPLAVQMAVTVLFLAIWQDFTRTVVEGEDYRLIQGVVGYFERLRTSREASIRHVAMQTHSVITRLSQEVEQRRSAAESRVAAGGHWDDLGTVESFGQLLERLGAPKEMIAAMGLSNPRDAADHIFSDRPHDWSRNVKLEPGTSSRGDRTSSTNNTPMGSTTPISVNAVATSSAPASSLLVQHKNETGVNSWDGEVPSAVLSDSANEELATSWSPTDLALNFDLQGLMVPEYADVAFGFDAFTTQDFFPLDNYQ
ncbi:BZ3500_MvSof-1268-A1-R1_Chr2-1g04500 [Microbotryum saponariae]|uniref:BZ3500_MvSof-1268-A1-R1_Chr2-1g04500 protein n=1 Tax=Microbotryum saponariae TaxID=289078 RepID=A0A2X0MI45_9BASI|nr:BZ3500_MvSof-1268-A1-R1_Chr2-1g04500 [Microbotryum saponariae]SCZ91854.1 BZ3501_MvSof-1269-A2-R1_Chr2-1g04156 [Microbotryum saponariae]